MKHGNGIASPLWVGFDGKSLPPRLSRWLAGGWVGGVVLFARNIECPAQVRALVPRDPLRRGPRQPPPLIAVDQEGGRVARFKDPPYTGFPPPAPAPSSAAGARSVAEAVGAAIGAELRAVGIDVNFAPVLDVDSNPAQPGDRGPRLLRRPGRRRAASGSRSRRARSPGGSSPVGKHFPGHGDTSADSHKELPVVRAGRKTLLRRELLPFRRASARGSRR